MPADHPFVSSSAISAESAWLRRLSAALVGSGDDADDAVQETWLAGLVHPPQAPEPLLPRFTPADPSQAGGPRSRPSARTPPDLTATRAALQDRMGEVAERVKLCMRRWATVDEALKNGVRLTIGVDEVGLQDVWVEDRADMPSGSLGCLSEAVYQTDWSGVTAVPFKTSFTVRYERTDGGPP
jgi:hypothetical protein